MLLWKSLRTCVSGTSFRNATIQRHAYTTARRHHDPLNILFCGSDEFSIYSLSALHTLHKARPDVVSGLEVVCRPDKRVGRGLKHLQQVPIKLTANELGLQLHQIDTFKGWTLPERINLIVAVSFGLLVPLRVLGSAEYGGLNVHPSLLPDLRGPAPIVHALLKRRSHTGVTLQTMHPTKFDHGAIVAQTGLPGIPMPLTGNPDDLLHTLGPLGAEMLCKCIECATFVPPFEEVQLPLKHAQEVDHAPKITPEDRRIDWNVWSSDEIHLRDAVLGRLWDSQMYSRVFPHRTAKRITYHGPWMVVDDSEKSSCPGQARVMLESNTAACIGIVTVDGKVIIPGSLTIEGEAKGKGVAALVAALRSKI